MYVTADITGRESTYAITRMDMNLRRGSMCLDSLTIGPSRSLCAQVSLPRKSNIVKGVRDPF